MDANEAVALAWELRRNMLRAALGILRRDADAEDAVADAIFKAYQQSSQLKDERKFKAWIMRIVVRNCYDILRKHEREELTDDFAPYDEPALETADGSVLDLIRELPAHYRDVLVLHYYEGYKAREIARILSASTVAVLVRLSRGREKLRELIEKEDYFDEKEDRFDGKHKLRQDFGSSDRDGKYQRTSRVGGAHASENTGKDFERGASGTDGEPAGKKRTRVLA